MYVKNSRLNDPKFRVTVPHLTNIEITQAETYLFSILQNEKFEREICTLKKSGVIHRSSCLRSLNPFLDQSGLLRVGGRRGLSGGRYDSIHPIILHGNHQLTRLLIRAEHIRILHGGVTAVNSTISLRFHIIGGRKTIRNTIRQCVKCRRVTAQTTSQQMGNLPIERISQLDYPFSNVGIDYAGPFHVKYGYVRKPTVAVIYQ